MEVVSSMSVSEKGSNLRTENRKGWIGFAPQNKLCCFWLLKINPKILRLLTLSSRLFPNSLPHSASLSHSPQALKSQDSQLNSSSLPLSTSRCFFCTHVTPLFTSHIVAPLYLTHSGGTHLTWFFFFSFFPSWLVSPSPFALALWALQSTLSFSASRFWIF